MRKILAASAMLLAGSAWGQGTWPNDEFTVSSNDVFQVDASIVGGSVVMYEYSLPAVQASPGSDNIGEPQLTIQLDFAPQPGYALVGELVTYSLNMGDVAYDAPSTEHQPAKSLYDVDINGEYTRSATSYGGITHYSGSDLLHAPDLVASLHVGAWEGIACPIGHEDNDCNYGFDLRWLDAYAYFTSFNVTPLLSPVPEPDMATAWLSGIGLLALLRRRNRRATGDAAQVDPSGLA